MKRLKSISFALALMLGISGAVFSTVQAMPKQGSPTYDWTSTAIAPLNPSSNLANATVSAATTHFGCSTGPRVCANGTLHSGSGAPTAQIKQP